MKRYTYTFIALFILCQLSLPAKATDRIRCASVAGLSPVWMGLSSAKEGYSKVAAIWPSTRSYISPQIKNEIEGLKLENHNLHYQVELLKAQVDLEKLVGEEAELLKRFVHDDAYAKRRTAEIFRLIDLYTPSIIGKVIFRETASWSSSLWINLGQKTNQVLGKTVIAKNSPVVVGTSLLGIVEYVGEHRSRIRLITDSSIIPSVRILRGSEQKQAIAQIAKKLSDMLDACEEISQDQPIKKELNRFFQSLNPNGKNFYLAKGELRGMREPLFRSRHALLQGTGFNYDFEDEEGPARDLKSGKPVSEKAQEISLIQKGDILVTTGMDGIFPAGLRAGQVSKVFPLREGATAYELDALPLIENFDDISYVTVLPPLNLSD
ncbi:MAG TPA: rod shape-determining protein MreC [Rhabdochlamydiaceae bacterium]|nr:rod shape-determining protein MreC [Rhabdochlamydiaceae bacterium]